LGIKRLCVWGYLAEVIRLFCRRYNISVTDFVSTLIFTAIFHDRTSVVIALQDLGLSYDEANELAAELYGMLKAVLSGKGSPRFEGVI